MNSIDKREYIREIQYNPEPIDGPYLVHLLPALRVLDAQRSMVMQQTLADLRIGLLGHGQIERRQATGVLVVGRGAQLQKCAVKYDRII